jgi:GNAT superfamily N-acetyltransferase
VEIKPMTAFTLRATTPADVPTLHDLMRDFSVHERAQERFQITEGGLHEALFSPNPAISSVLADSDGMTVGFALWFFFFGTFSGRYGLWVANLYVEEPYRGIGIGLALFSHMARIAIEKDCVAMQWEVNDWNRQAIEFYDRIGSTPVSGTRLVKEMTGDALTALAKGNNG